MQLENESQDLDSVPTLPLGTVSLWEKSLKLFKQPQNIKTMLWSKIPSNCEMAMIQWGIQD